MEWGPISIGVTVGLSILAIILTRKLIRRKKPTWAYTTEKLIGLGTDAPKELQLTFNGKPVTDVYQTTFIFFNSGRETILKKNVTKPCTMHFHEGEILREPIITTTSNEEIKFSAKHVISKDGHAVRLDFLYLDHEDGGVFEVLHTESSQITPTGNIIGAKKIDNIGKLILYSRQLSLIKIMLRVGGGSISAGVPLTIYGRAALVPGATLDISTNPFAFIGLMFLTIGLTLLIPMAIGLRRHMYFIGLPRWYRVYLGKAERKLTPPPRPLFPFFP